MTASDVWVVNPKFLASSFGRRVAKHPSRYRLFPRMFSRTRGFLQALEPRAWLYNLTIFFPILFMGIPIKLEIITALFTLCLVTSGTSVLRDLIKMDLHRKQAQTDPFSKGHIGAGTGLVLGLLLLTFGLFMGTLINPALLILLILWAFLIIQDDGSISGISRIFTPILVGCFIG